MAKFAKIIHQNNEIFLIKKFIRLFEDKVRNNIAKDRLETIGKLEVVMEKSKIIG